MITGGLGSDSYVVNNLGDKVTELASQGSDTVYASFDYKLGANVEVLVLTGGARSGTGNAASNRIEGNDQANRLDGGLGADLMRGVGGNDQYIVDDVGDRVIEGSNAGSDTVFATVNYTLADNVENLQLSGTGAFSGTGNGLANALGGNDGDNLLTGLAGNDALSGGSGNDRLIGGAGGDRLTGGAGTDMFTFTALSDSFGGAGSRDLITDFSHAALDRIDLSKIDANGVETGDGVFKLVTSFDGSAGALTVTAKGSQWLVEGDVNGDKVADFAILVNSSTALVAGDFVM
jgi:Ca2+-binding RTX toxin-like protein